MNQLSIIRNLSKYIVLIIYFNPNYICIKFMKNEICYKVRINKIFY